MNAIKSSVRDYIKANRRASRKAEIENHSHPISLAGYTNRKRSMSVNARGQMIKGICLLSFYIVWQYGENVNIGKFN